MIRKFINSTFMYGLTVFLICFSYNYIFNYTKKYLEFYLYVIISIILLNVISYLYIKLMEAFIIPKFKFINRKEVFMIWCISLTVGLIPSLYILLYFNLIDGINIIVPSLVSGITCGCIDDYIIENYNENYIRTNER